MSSHVERTRAALVGRSIMASLLLSGIVWAGSDIGVTAPGAPARAEPLRFTISEGEIDNHFYRDGPVAAHVLTKSGTSPRLLFAFPAGNTAVGAWFSAQPEAVSFHVVPGTQLEPVLREAGMRGVSARLRVDAARFRLERALLTNVRIMRDFTVGEETASITPALSDMLAYEIVPGWPLVLRRQTLDGRHVELDLAPEKGTTLAFEDGDVVFVAPTFGPIELTATALTDYEPLTPLPEKDVLRPEVGGSERLREVLTFLSYEEKLLAGSWRFLTYFGRDTLISVFLLLPALAPPAIEAGLGSVLERLAPDGNVAHEEDLGEFAALEHLRRGPPYPRDLSQPIYDYKMIDDDLLLAPAAAAYLLDTSEGRSRAEAFLSKTTSSGTTYRQALRQNLAFVVSNASAYALEPIPENLLAIWAHTTMGQWRDSLLGLAIHGSLAVVALEVAAAALHDPTVAVREVHLGSRTRLPIRRRRGLVLRQAIDGLRRLVVVFVAVRVESSRLRSLLRSHGGGPLALHRVICRRRARRCALGLLSKLT